MLGAMYCWLLSAKFLATFVDALVVNVDDLMQCRLVYRDTDPSNLDKRRIGRPCVLG